LRDERLQCRLSSKLKEQAERLAKKKHMSLTAFIVQLLTHAVEADQLIKRDGQEAEQI
jgi:predicted HicB family RNase H-like nuclease